MTRAPTLRWSPQTVVNLRARIEEAREVHAPRRKFAFRSRRVRAGEEGSAASQTASDSPTAEDESSASPSPYPVAQTDDHGAPDDALLHDLTNAHITIKPGELGGPGKSADARLTRLRSCTVCLCETLYALRCDDLEDCTIYVGAVAGSVMLDGCRRCTLVIAARQVCAQAACARVHTSTAC